MIGFFRSKIFLSSSLLNRIIDARLFHTAAVGARLPAITSDLDAMSLADLELIVDVIIKVRGYLLTRLRRHLLQGLICALLFCALGILG